MPLTITRRHVTRFLGVLLVLVVAAGVSFALVSLFRKDNAIRGFDDPAKFQAVVLQNNQLYFGHLSDRGDGYLVLDDAYFVRQSSSAQSDGSTGQQVVSLNGELHGPENHILIPRESVISIENLGDQSAILATIKKLEQK